MKNLIALLLLLAAGSQACAQIYPSPIFQDTHVLGKFTLSGACDTSNSLGMDPTGATDNTAALAPWQAALAISASHIGCLHFGPGVFKFASTPTIVMPNGLWSSQSNTSATLPASVGTNVNFTIATGLTIPVNGSVFAVHNTLSTSQIIVAKVISYNPSTGALVIQSTSPSVGSGTFTNWDILQGYTGATNIGAVTWEGDGPDVTELRFTGTINGPKFQFAGLIQQLNLHDMSITTDTHSTGTVGLLLTNSFPFLGAEQNLNTVERVIFRGADGYGSVDAWGSGVLDNYLSQVNFNDDEFYGHAGGQGALDTTGINFQNAGTHGCVGTNGQWECGENYNIRGSYFQNLNNSIFYGPNTQFVSVTQSQFNNDNIAVIVGGAEGVLQGLDFSHNICFVYLACVEDNNGVKNVNISNNPLIALNSTSPAIYLQNNWAFTVEGNQFTPFSASATLQPAINIAGVSNDLGIISGNVIAGGGGGSTFQGECIFLGTTSTLVNVQSNAYSGCAASNVNNLGTGNTVGGGSK